MQSRFLSIILILILPIITSHKSVVQTKEDQQINPYVTSKKPAYCAVERRGERSRTKRSRTKRSRRKQGQLYYSYSPLFLISSHVRYNDSCSGRSSGISRNGSQGLQCCCISPGRD